MSKWINVGDELPKKKSGEWFIAKTSWGVRPVFFMDWSSRPYWQDVMTNCDEGRMHDDDDFDCRFKVYEWMSAPE